jgi:hypothetical protein
MRIKILDSLQLLKDNLRNILKSYNCAILKGLFPYRFMNQDRLFYVGKKPELNYYDGIDISEYNKILNEDWSAEDETLRYLRSDLLGLLEVVLKFSKNYFDKYQINITKYRTLPALTYAMFTSRFYDEDYKIKMVKGNLEKEIRKSYFGGNVDVFIHEIMDEAYYYDMNSQYPFAMLNDMPIGNPILTDEKDITNFFGFAYGEIIPPSEEVLKNLYIQKRNTDGSVSCPRDKFCRLIFSEEIKYAIGEGYQFNMEWGYKFKRGKGVFDEFVKELYKDKKESNNPVLKLIAKYSLNSLYGKFGQKDISSNIKIIKRKDIKSITTKYNYQYISEINSDFSIIKYSSRINEKLRLLYKKELLENDIMMDGLFKSSRRGIPSAVHIAAAISAYARISINKFKNIPGNVCYYSDTDSVILAKKLADILVGKELGQMKLEYHIKEGIIIRNKLYALVTPDKGVVIKSSGVNNRKLNYNDFKELLNGKTIEIKSTAFLVGWKNLRVNVAERKIKLKGIKLSRFPATCQPLYPNPLKDEVDWDDHDKEKIQSDKIIENNTIASNDNIIAHNEDSNLSDKIKDESSKTLKVPRVSRIKGKGEIGKRKFSTSLRILSRNDNDDLNIQMKESQSNPITKDKSDSMKDEEIKNGFKDKIDSTILRYDGSKTDNILSRKNGIYRIYNNIFLDDKKLFIKNLTDILEILYDNNSFTIFKLYFLLSIENKDLRRVIKFDVVNLNKHLSQYDPHILNDNITGVYKNTGLLLGVNVLVFTPNYDIENLIKISSSIWNEIHKNISIINDNVFLDQKNSIINFTRKIRSEDEIMLLIGADFNDKMNEDMQKWNLFLASSRQNPSDKG